MSVDEESTPASTPTIGEFKMNAEFQRRVKNVIQMPPDALAQRKKFMELAVVEGRKAIASGAGGPFGAVVVKDNEVVVSYGYNMVFETQDITAHAEVVAIRNATKKLGRFDLSDCELYTTCEPCPLCLAATYWSKIHTIYYGITQEQNVMMGFPRGRQMYETFEKKGSDQLAVVFAYEDVCEGLMKEWLAKDAQGKQFY